MPIDLKAPLDAVYAARDSRDKVAADVAAWIAEKAGTEEITAESLALQNKALDDAEQKYSDLLATYEKLVKANQPSDTAKLFVPANQTATEEEKPKVMKRNEFFALSTSDRAVFIKDGGKLED